jgi:4-aminobutyrate aminotransferase-like enzyme/Ser/Thr protein kinase RdoA (MazF antagonist)
MALRTAQRIVGIDAARRAARELYGLDASPAGLPGERDCNFRLDCGAERSVLLKILAPGSNPADIDCQVKVLKHLARRDPDLPVPRILPTLSGADSGAITVGTEGFATLALTWLAGDALATARRDESLIAAVGAAIARMTRALRGFEHPGLARPLAWDVRRLPQLVASASDVVSPTLRGLIESVLARAPALALELDAARAQAIHGDCHGSNLLVSATAVSGIFDFGDVIRAPLILEPAVAMSELLTERLVPLDSLDALLRGFVAVQGLQAAEIDLLFDLIAGRHAATLLIHAWRRRHDPKGAAAVEAAAAAAGESLGRLVAVGPEALAARWHAAAGTHPARSSLVRRRLHWLGSGSELFYERPLHIVRGDDVWLIDAGGRRYLDLYNNVPHVGHAHPTVVAAIQRQTALLATHTRYLHEGILDYAEQLCSRLPPRFDACLFVNSGSEANDVAWRMARFATGRAGAVIIENAYHGITAAVSALTPAAGAVDARWVAALPAPRRGWDWDSVPQAADLAAARADVERALAGLQGRGYEPAAFYLDSAFTSNGVYDPPAAWLAVIVERLRAAGTLIVADEVQYGLGRSGSHFWGFERRGFDPDIVTLGKPVGNGFPMGVVIANRRLVEAFQARHGFFSTFGGNAVAAAAGLAVLEVLERERLMANAAETGEQLRAALEALRKTRACFGELRGAGLLWGLEVVGADGRGDRAQARRIVDALARDHGVLTGLEGPAGNVLKLRPPMTLRAPHVELVAAALAASAAAAS